MVVKIHPDAKVFFDGYLCAIGINKKNQNKFETKDKDRQFLLWLANEGVFSPFIKKIDIGYFNELVEKGFLALDGEEGKENFETERKVFESYIRKLPKERARTPVLLCICITNKCNLKCRHCANNSCSNSNSFLTFEEIKNLVDQAEEMNTMKLTLTGGEPLLHESIFDIIDYSFEKIPRLGLTTNGYFFDGRTIEKIKNKVDVVKVSLDGLEKFHDEFRAVGSYEKAINAIKLLIKEKIETRVQITLVKENRGDIKKLIPILNELGVNRISVVPVTPTGRAKGEMMLTPLEYRAFLYDILEFLKKIKLKSEVELRPLFTFIGKESMKDPNIIGNKYKCEALRSSLDILSNGDVIPCSFLHEVIGNVRKNSLKEIWEGKEADEVRSLLNAVKNNPKCNGCSFRDLCESGCVANSFAIHGKIGRDTYCWNNLEAVK